MYYSAIQSIATGFTNQLFSFITGIINAHKKGEKVVIIDKFRNDIHKDEFTPISGIFNISDINIFLKKNYDIIIVDKYAIQFEILSATYGSNNSNYIDLTSFILKNHFKDGKLYINKNCCFNEIQGDPCYGKCKTFILKYKISNNIIEEIYEENLKNDIVIDFDSNYINNGGWIDTYNDNMFDKILTSITYINDFVTKSEKIIKEINITQTINIIHLRLEDDGIAHWSRINNITHNEYKKVLEEKYINLFEKYLSKDDQNIILSSCFSNRIIDYLIKNNYNYKTIRKFCNDREKNAIVDFLVSKYCNNIFIGNFNMKKLNGSTFSYYIGKSLEDHIKSIIYIDLDSIFDKEALINF